MQDHRPINILFSFLFILVLIVPALAVTETFFPVDEAMLVHNPAGAASFSDLRNGVGTSLSRSTGDQYVMYLKTLAVTNTTDGWDYDQHVGYIFDTSTLDDTAEITGAYINLWETGGNTYLGGTSLVFTGGSTDDGNISFATGDYNSWVSPVLTGYVTMSSGTDAWKTHTLNTAGLAYINKTGNTTFYGLSSWDIGNAGPTWLTNTYTRQRIWQGLGNATYNPRLVVTYYIPSFPTANFTSNKVTCTEPCTVTFTDTSENVPTSWNWSFGDGSYSNSQNPSHVYTWNGTYTVILMATNSIGGDSETKTKYITVNPPAPTAAFTGFPLSGSPPLTVTFTDSSLYTPTSWLWDFGDGDSTNNTVQNPIHTYADYGTYTVSLTATNAYGSDGETKTGYVSVVDANYGDHPYLFFHNITELDGYTYYTTSPWSGWYSNIYTNRYDSVGSSPNQAIWYHLCKNVGGTGCSAYANLTIAGLQTISNTSGGSGANGPMYYAIEYDLIAGTKDTGETTLTTEIDNNIRDRLAKIADDNYNQIATDPGRVNYNDGRVEQYIQIWLIGEVLHDYDTTGKGLSSDVSDWLEFGQSELFVSSTVVTAAEDPGGFFFYQVNKTGGKETYGTYYHYFDEVFYTIPAVYSRIHGNVFDANPGFKNFWMQWLYSPFPNNYQNNYLESSMHTVIATKTGLEYLPVKERSWLRWLSQNTTEMRKAKLLDNTDFYYPDAWILFLTYNDYTSEPIYRPVHKNWFTPIFSVLRTGWTENSDWISITGRSLESGMNAIDDHHDQLAVEFFGHGDNTIIDGSQARDLLKSAKNGGFEMRGDTVMHNVLMFDDPRGTFANEGHTNITATGVGRVTTEQVVFPSNIDSQSVGYVQGYVNSTNRQIAYHIDTTLGTNINWTREIVSPQNEYFVVIDRATSPWTWLYKSHWNFGSINSTNVGKEYLPTDLGLLDNHVNGDLVVGTTDINWEPKPFILEENLSITTNTIVWNTTNERGINISTKLFSVPASPVSFYKYGARTGGNDYSNEDTVPHIFFNSPEDTEVYRITAILPSWETDTALPVPSELTVTGDGSALRINASTGTQKDYFYTGLGVSNFSTFQTDADTVFVRKSDDTTIQSYLLVNGSYLYDGAKVFESSIRLNYISFNKTTTGQGGQFNVSCSGSTVLSFYTVVTVNNMTRNEIPFYTWVMDGTTLNVTTDTADSYFEFGDVLEGYTDEGLGEFMYNETPAEETSTETFYAISTNADARLSRDGVSESYSDIVTGAGTTIALTGDGSEYNLAGERANSTNDEYNSSYIFGWSANTSSIPDDATITSATFALRGGSKSALLGNGVTTITEFYPLDPTLLTVDDYNRTSNLIYTSNKTYAAFTSSAWNYYYFTNLSAINKTGITSLAFKTTSNADQSDSSLVWGSGLYNQIWVAETSHATYPPYLNVLYTLPETAAPVAAIVADPESGEAPLTVAFYDDSTGNVTSWLWTFDGVNTSSARDIEWIFSAGVYNVSLYVENEIGNDTAYQEITVTNATPIASFTTDRNVVRIPGSVAFTDTSTGGITSWNWSFGDGIYNTTQNTTHKYLKRGAFNVSLLATNDNGNNTAYKEIRVIGSSPQDLLIGRDILYDTELQIAILFLCLILAGGYIVWKKVR